MKKITLDEKKAFALWMNSTLVGMAKTIADSVGEIENDEDVVEAITEAIKLALVYDSDRWEIIKEYSIPENPINFFDAVPNFADDMSSCINCVNADAGKFHLIDYKVKRKSDSPTWNAAKAEIRSEGGYDGEMFEVGTYDSAEEAEKAARDDWERLEKTDQYKTCYDIERIGEDPDGIDDEIIKSFDFWQDMLKEEETSQDD